MSVEILLWVMGVTIPAGLAWAVAVMWILRDIRRTTSILLEMHQNPTQYGLGVGPSEAKLGDIHSEMKTLVHYVRWSAEQSTGTSPPPPIP